MTAFIAPFVKVNFNSVEDSQKHQYKEIIFPAPPAGRGFIIITCTFHEHHLADIITKSYNSRKKCGQRRTPTTVRTTGGGLAAASAAGGLAAPAAAGLAVPADRL